MANNNEVVVVEAEIVKHKVGRPSKYKPEYAEQAYKYCLLNADDSRLAKLFDVEEKTVNNWKEEHPEFLQSIKAGKEIADAEIGKSLYSRATGYNIPEEKIFVHQGEVIRAETTKHIPPDPTSMIFWLKNRQPKQWRDKTELSIVPIQFSDDTLLED